MKRLKQSICWAIFCVAIVQGTTLYGQDKQIPEVLQPWRDWVTWDAEHQACPPLYSNAGEQICYWPSRLSLAATQSGGSWQVEVRVFGESWISLPGSVDAWPTNVRAGGEPIPVVERQGVPAVRLVAGVHQLSGEFQWDEMPQRIAVPKQVGILTLTVAGGAIPIPRWDAAGHVWLKRLRVESTDEDLLAAKVYRVVEDGIPVWLRTEIELTVSGRSREEELGWVLPEGWVVSRVESPIPVAMNERGEMKAQVRAGKWTVSVHAFRADRATEFQFAADAKPVTAAELIGFRANPGLRVAEIDGLQAVDVTQTTFPQKWRDLPVYQWVTNKTFQLAEKMRGMGDKRPAGLSIARHFWLDEDGQGITYRDELSGVMQQIWRLDVAGEQQLGAVRLAGEGQLITKNPTTGSDGVEIRNRNVSMEAIGRIPAERSGELSATGWEASAANLDLTITLPPGWRVFALFGADEVRGDWLTAWTLLDLFLLLIFSLSVFRLWGFKAGIVALLAFALAYHEVGAPRYAWFFLLIPAALLKFVPEGVIKTGIKQWKYAAALLLLILLVPFVIYQVQSAIFPQLEEQGFTYGQRDGFGLFDSGTYAVQSSRMMVQEAMEDLDATASRAPSRQGWDKQTGLADFYSAGNMGYDPNAKIQTGPAEPQWSWNNVYCSWNGTVAAGESIRPLLISPPVHRVLTVVRALLLLLLTAILLGVRIRRPAIPTTTTAAAILLGLFLIAEPASAQVPSQQMLDTLRERLLETSDAFPGAAEISNVDLKLDGNKISMQVEVHAVTEVAVPLPGRLPAWSPVSVKLNGTNDALVSRRDGYLWATVTRGVHRFQVEGLLPDATEWAWTFLLKPRHVTIDAVDWNVTGIRRNGVPRQQVFFARKQKATEGEAAYDQRNFHAIARVDRYVEIGLIWKVRNVVTRLSAPGKAISLRIPLLAGERVLTSSARVQGGTVEVGFGAEQATVSWESELPIRETMELKSAATNAWVERWHLVTSPVWNVELSGSELAPIFEAGAGNLVPIWYPWPGEGVTLAFRRPQAVSGDTVTVRSVHHEITLGDRERSTILNLDLECSLGGDFVMQIDPAAEISTLTRDGTDIPVRRDGAKLFVPLQPGKQAVAFAWRVAEAMRTVVQVEKITLPVDGSNVTTTLHVPSSRWVLWTQGPLRGPAVRFWTILVVALPVAVILGSISISPLGRINWMLLAIGLTQVNVIAAMFVVGWLFLLAWRGQDERATMMSTKFNFLQLAIVGSTLIALLIFVGVVGAGLLGDPKMFIVGNGSSQTYLNWFQPRVGAELPEPMVVSTSVWFYRLAMLAWALWLAVMLLRWLIWGWQQFSKGGFWKRDTPKREAAVVTAEVVGGPQADSGQQDG